ncbi:MAG: hemerythrin domain-containing protein [Rhodocyclaceae bacterium]|nr:hemerythrin domain-containing protein [Rhodocyclaceae bacterium]
MFLFDLLFGKKKKPEAPAKTPAAAAKTAPASAVVNAPGTRIHHDSGLIAAFRSDHQLLLEIFTAIGEASHAGDLVETQKRLGHFRTVLMDHLLKENIRLYVYLEHLLANDPTRRQMVHEFRHEMDAIGRVVVGFLGKYKAIASQPELAAPFAKDLVAIGEALVARIRREEDLLYPMYVAP